MTTESAALTRRIERFFEDYARAASTPDLTRVAEAYGSGYMESTPGAVGILAVDDDFRLQLTKHDRLLRQELGFEDATATVREVAPLAPGHATAVVDWRMAFAPPARTRVVASFTQTYVLRVEPEHLQILLCISHQDEGEVMRQTGLLPVRPAR